MSTRPWARVCELTNLLQTTKRTDRQKDKLTMLTLDPERRSRFAQSRARSSFWLSKQEILLETRETQPMQHWQRKIQPTLPMNHWHDSLCSWIRHVLIPRRIGHKELVIVGVNEKGADDTDSFLKTHPTKNCALWCTCWAERCLRFHRILLDKERFLLHSLMKSDRSSIWNSKSQWRCFESWKHTSHPPTLAAAQSTAKQHQVES